MPGMPEREQRATIVDLAREMAMTGQYRGWRAIETRLRADGLPRVREALADEGLREELDRQCVHPPVQR